MRRIDKNVPKKNRNRGPVTIYIDRQAFEQFKKRTSKRNKSASMVLDEMIKAWLEINP